MTKRTKTFGRRPNSTKSKALQSSVPSPAEQAGQSSGYRGGTDDLDQGLSVTLTNKDLDPTQVVGMWIDSRNLDLVTEVLHPRQERLVEDSGASSKPWWETL